MIPLEWHCDDRPLQCREVQWCDRALQVNGERRDVDLRRELHQLTCSCLQRSRGEDTGISLAHRCTLLSEVS